MEMKIQQPEQIDKEIDKDINTSEPTIAISIGSQVVASEIYLGGFGLGDSQDYGYKY